jgi:hypothetical protein
MSRPLWNALALGLALATTGCSACSGETVPFGLDAGRPARPSVTANTEPAPARPTERIFPDGTRRIEVEGAPLESEGSFRALWAHDADRDGDRDALVVIAGGDGALRLAFARRDGPTFAALETLDDAPPAEGCRIEQPSIAALGERWLTVRAAVRCPDQAAQARDELWVVAAEATPRVLEHLAVLDAEGRAPGAVELALSAADRDEDGHEDLVVRVSVTPPGVQGSPVELPWLDRPSGLARDPAEPERTLAERARAGLRLLRRQPARALTASRQVLALHAALCREPGRARLRVGDTDGIPCGTSQGAGRAATTEVRALAQQGQLLEALTALERMEGPGLAIDDERRQAAREAIAGAPATPGVTLREGPAHTAPRWTALRLPALAFLDENRILLRGEAPRVFDLATGREQPAEPDAAELRVVDPSGTYAVAGVERRCVGYVLRIVRAASFVAGQVLGATHGQPLLAAREPPAGAPCPDLTPSLRRDDGGFRVLGWAPQGVVVARESELLVVPLDLSAQPAGDPEVLAPGTLPPAPLPPGAVTPNGRHRVEVRGLGVLVHRVTPSPEPVLLWPEGWAAREGEVSDAAIAPSGRRVAVLRGGRVLVLERAAP